GNGPRQYKDKQNISFDDFILEKISDQGIDVLREKVKRLDREEQGFHIYTDKDEYHVAFLCGAFGLNSPLIKDINNVLPAYIAPKVMRTYLAELEIGEKNVQRYFGNTIYTYNIPTRRILYGSVIPKSNFITINLIGKKDLVQNDLHEFIEQSGILSRLPPDFSLKERFCHCSPRITSANAQNAYDDRILLLGDAAYSKFYKNGIESAFITAEKAAQAVFKTGIDRTSLEKGYFSYVKQHIIEDNRYGRFLYFLNDVISRFSFFNMANMQIANSVQFHRSADILRNIFWIMFTGKSPYKEAWKQALNPLLIILFFQYSLRSLYRTILSRVGAFFTGKKTCQAQINPGPLKNGSVVAVVGGGASRMRICDIPKKIGQVKRNVYRCAPL
ncbi:MAG: hypothetical protein HQK83_14630, partial [Fibrobacteria bacterium]|nr:hypothetical protein [Fibrobacteria bacterium]